MQLHSYGAASDCCEAYRHSNCGDLKEDSSLTRSCVERRCAGSGATIEPPPCMSLQSSVPTLHASRNKTAFAHTLSGTSGMLTPTPCKAFGLCQAWQKLRLPEQYFSVLPSYQTLWDTSMSCMRPSRPRGIAHPKLSTVR